MTKIDLGRLGIWRPQGDLDPGLAKDVEDLGYGTIWVGASPGGDLDVVERLLAATDRVVVATGIVNMWATRADEVAASYHRLADAYGGRFLLGVGIGHPEATREYRSRTRRSSATSTTWTPRTCPPRGGCWPRWGRRCCGWRRNAPPARTRT
ncbi:LLM class flavin-dependent oxidoreductase [Actinomadura spongiicola]|uniref:LLM class flavin-dependent oxidoreductase n=1 Tax=Actinomadura spongiicola TaxID=2303421 RepID=UPI001F2607F4|nr:LLM class flavin-dependent oxidoreductase [Actinomadura spongiicola]